MNKYNILTIQICKHIQKCENNRNEALCPIDKSQSFSVHIPSLTPTSLIALKQLPDIASFH